MTSEEVKIQQFWIELRCHTLQTQNIQENCMAWANRYADILSNFANSDSTILHNNFLHCFSVLNGCWRAGPSRASVVIHLLATFCEELVPLVNTFLTYSTLTVCNFQHFKCFWALNSIFYTKFDAYSLIHFFRQQKIANTRKTLLAFMPLTNRKKNRKSNVHRPRNLKIHLIFWTGLVYVTFRIEKTQTELKQILWEIILHCYDRAPQKLLTASNIWKLIFSALGSFHLGTSHILIILHQQFLVLALRMPSEIK